MPLHGKNFIGHPLSADGNDTFESVNPVTSQHIAPPFHNATDAEVDRALELAASAFEQRRGCDPKQTAALLEAIATKIEDLGDELIERGQVETGLPATRLKMERGRTCGQLRMFGRLVAEGSWVDARIDRALPKRKPIPKPDLRRMLIPIGPVAVFPASNFPMAFSVAGGDTASALAAGCPVIVKARPSHAGTSELVAQAVAAAMVEVGMPDGWFSMLHGPGRSVGVKLVEHPAIKAVGFTGSLSGGRALMDAAAARPDPIPVYAEMGSINPVFLLPEALAQGAETLAAGLHQSVSLGVGQFCTNPGLVVAMAGDDLDRMLGALAEAIEATEPGTMLMGAICDSYQSGLERLAAVDGVELRARSKQDPQAEATQAAAALLVTDASTFLADDALTEEVFGPATLVVRCSQPGELLAVARRLEGQLTATLHATGADLADHGDLVAALAARAGRLLYGGFPTGVEVCASMNHGGPYPATSDAQSTSVGTAAIQRFARPLCFQNAPDGQLPPELRNRNELAIWRLVDDVQTKEDV